MKVHDYIIVGLAFLVLWLAGSARLERLRQELHSRHLQLQEEQRGITRAVIHAMGQRR